MQISKLVNTRIRKDGVYIFSIKNKTHKFVANKAFTN